MSERTAQLNANQTELAELNALTGRLLASINTLVATTSEPGACVGPAGIAPFWGNCSAYWSSFYPAVIEGYNFTNTTSLTAAQLQYVFSEATSAMLAASPYSEEVYNSDRVISFAPLYGKGTGTRNVRGGINGEYTMRFFMNSQLDFINGTDYSDAPSPPVPSSSPFKQILAVGNGGWTALLCLLYVMRILSCDNEPAPSTQHCPPQFCHI